MKCFTHRSSEAIAICRSCGRALCPDCISEVGLSCACKSRCESDVARFNQMLTQDAHRLSCACKSRCESDVARFNQMLTQDAHSRPTRASKSGKPCWL